MKKEGKAEVLLMMYDSLQNEGKITNESLRDGKPLAPITFKRYVYNIRDHYARTRPSVSLKYVRRLKAYVLVKKA
jgi:hypothetical protein